MVNASQEAAKDVVTREKVNNVLLEEKAVSQEPLTYADKLVHYITGHIPNTLLVALLIIDILVLFFSSLPL